MTLNSNLNRFLSRPPRLFLWRREGVRTGTQGTGPSFLIVSRGLCRFRSFGEVEGQNAAQRRAALNLRIRSWSPFRDAGHLSVAEAGHHMVWAWSQSDAAAALTASGVKRGRAHLVPETLFQDPIKNGVRLVACLDGVEGQVWNDGVLVESRWWPEDPSPAEWIAFQRAAGLKPDRMIPNVPQAVKPRWRERPWGGVEMSLAGLVQRLEPVEWMIAAGVVLAAPAIFFLAEGFRVDASLSAKKQQIAALEQSAGPIIEAQNQALNAAQRVRQLTALDPYPSQIEIMARVATALPEDGTRLIDWTYQNGDLTVTMTKPPTQVDATSYVRRFQDAGMFSDVAVDLANPQQLKVTMKVLPAALVTANAAASPAPAMPPGMPIPQIPPPSPRPPGG